MLDVCTWRLQKSQVQPWLSLRADPGDKLTPSSEGPGDLRGQRPFSALRGQAHSGLTANRLSALPGCSWGLGIQVGGQAAAPPHARS